MSQTTSDMILVYNNKEFPVPAGFTAEDYKQSLAVAYPEVANASLIKDGEKEGITRYTVKASIGTKG